MSRSDTLMQVLNRARGMWRSRDPDSYSRYERDQDYARKQADHDLEAEEHSAQRARDNVEREHGFHERYAAEHRRGAEHRRTKPPGNT